MPGVAAEDGSVLDDLLKRGVTLMIIKLSAGLHHKVDYYWPQGNEWYAWCGECWDVIGMEVKDGVLVVSEESEMHLHECTRHRDRRDFDYESYGFGD